MFRFINQKLMLGTAVRLTPTFAISIFGDVTSEHDLPTTNKKEPEQTTGWDRVKAMYTRNEFDEVSAELHNVVQATMSGLFVGACLGGFAKSRDAYLNFIENNQATIFTSTLQAKKKLQDQVTIAFAKGAYHWGWRLGIFTGLFSLISTTASVYRDQTSFGDYVAAGTITGAIYKANLGARAMVAGAVLGGVLSSIGGIIIISILKITGINMSDIRKSFYKLKMARIDQYNQAVEKSSSEKHDSLTRHHDDIIEEKGVKKIEELP